MDGPASGKRQHEDEGLDAETGAVVDAKRARTEVVVVPTTGSLQLGGKSVRRTSSLDAPIMLLTGHSSQVLTMKFNPSGTAIASGSHDRHIYLWNVHGDCKNYMDIKGHNNAVVELHWTNDGQTLVSASPDKTIRAWDAETGKQVKRMAEHSGFVNSCCPVRRGPQLVVSGSDDGTAKLWDLRVRGCVQTLPEKFQVTCVAFGDSADRVYTGGIENEIKVWDLRKEEVVLKLVGHGDTLTGLALSPDGTHLLSNAMDCTLRVWDLRPYAPGSRCTRVLTGHGHDFEKNLLKCSWSPDGLLASCGSSDRQVHVWDVASRKLLYKLPGHHGCVNEVAFHPKEPIIGSCGSDSRIYLGEIDPWN